MTPEQFAALAIQLRTPRGAEGIAVAARMAQSNVVIMARAHQALQVQAGQSVVEIGPGNGVLSHDLVESLSASGHYIGIDRSADMVAAAQASLGKPGGPRVTFVHADCLQAELPVAGVHGITAVNLLYFIEDLRALFARMYRWLLPGGRVSLGIRSPSTMSALPFEGHDFIVRPLEEILSKLSHAGFVDVGLRFYSEGRRPLAGIEMDVDAVILCASKPS